MAGARCRAKSRSGLTMVEILVAVAIVVVLVAMAAVAVRAVMDSSRKSSARMTMRLILAAIDEYARFWP
ncbi:MAG: prepilin-type N-terminal cleavage/methylation domain-containing protein, partial [Phycisphaerae bacterium]